MSVNVEIADALSARTIDLMRFDAGVRRKVIGILTLLERELEKKIHRFDIEGVVRNTFKRRRAEVLIKNVRETIDSAYRDSNRQLRKELRALAKLEAEAAITIPNKAIGFDILTAQLNPDQLRTIVSEPIVGAPLKDWWKTQSNRTKNAFAQQVRLGTIAGETNQQIVQRIRGRATGKFISVEINGKVRRVREFSGGILDITKNHAHTTVRTAVQNVSNRVMMQTYEANDDIVAGHVWISTLDGRTTRQCIALSGGSWDIKTGMPFKDSPYQGKFPGPPPIHPNCRSTLGPITKSWEQMAQEASGKKLKILESMPTSARASMDGRVPGGLTWDGFLKRKGDAFARKKLGPGRFELWKKGKITTAQLIDQSARPLTLDQLRQLTPSRTPPVLAPAKA